MLLFLSLSLLLHAQEPATISSKTAKLQKQEGLFPFYWDARAGKLFLELPRLNQEFLYIGSLPAGLGSNDVGLDRGQLGSERLVRFERSGPKVLLIQSNTAFRALSSDPHELRAVRESFAEAVIYGFPIEAEQNGRILIDATNFFLRDEHGVADTLQSSRQGSYSLDLSRSAFFLERTKNFPNNTEVEVTLTFTGRPQGAYVREVAADPRNITIRQHHSFIQLPDAGYQPRAFDPRSGYYPLSYFDYATPVSEPIRKQFITRHRLLKKDPSAAVSEAVKPITYYLDRGAPEPIRSALLDGARWWNQAFEAAGFRNAFRVELLPENADPMDARYNLIQWVHRSTRGWSYGSSITDPRTGEIIKGHVTLGSLRVRQDFLIAEGLLAPYETGQPASPAMLEMALSRLRQLSAHEVGHTLGLSHNYVSSAANRASVMDYPHPLVTLNAAGKLDLSDAYTNVIGDWDKVAIRYGYADFGAEDPARLRPILEDAYKRGIYFLSDQDARPEGSAHPTTHLWDNGADVVDELNRTMQLRARALDQFGANNIPTGRPMSTLEAPLVTTYLMHRYQLEAAAKVLGGLHYTYALRGDGQTITKIVAPAEQRKALDALLKTIAPDALTLPERILQLLPPVALGFSRTREYFPSRSGLTFDPLAAAESAAALTIHLILHPERTARLVQYHARDEKNPGIEEIIDRLTQSTFQRPPAKGLAAEVGRTIDHAVTQSLIALAANERATAQVRAIATRKLDTLRAWLNTAAATRDSATKAHFQFQALQIKRYLDDPKSAPAQTPATAPPGMPIGMADAWCNAFPFPI